MRKGANGFSPFNPEAAMYKIASERRPRVNLTFCLEELSDGGVALHEQPVVGQNPGKTAHLKNGYVRIDPPKMPLNAQQFEDWKVEMRRLRFEVEVLEQDS